jgi:thiamine biosynthesis lipoprotein
MMVFVQSSIRSKVLCLLVVILYACEQAPEHQQSVILTGLTMGTTYTVKINSSESALDRSVVSADINRQLDNVNQQMSTYIETSDLSLFNQLDTKEWVEIPFELYTVIEEALRISVLSENAFDISIGPVVNLWGFGPEENSGTVPNDTAINKVLDKVGSQYIHLRSKPYSIRKDKPDLTIDLSAIAKGFAVDIIADYLDKLYINNYMVEIGGEIKAKGFSPDNKSWHIGIEKPLSDQRTVQSIVALNDTGMATSGGYRNYFEENGIRYSHTINPGTGKPITHNLASVTVLHPSTMTADAMATALLVLGSERGFELALKENLAALFIIREKDNFTEKMTPQFRDALVYSQ